MKRCSMSLATGEMQTKTTMSYHHMPIRTTNIKKKIVMTPNPGEDSEKLDHSKTDSLPKITTS